MFLNLLLIACGLDSNTSATPVNIPTPLPGFKGNIQIGAMFDLTTAPIYEAREYAAGVIGYITYLNSTGGAGGYWIDMRVVDYAGKAPVAIEQYQKLVNEGVLAFISWNHSDTLALSSQINDGKTPLFSASYRDELTRDTKKSPYNFMITPSYSDQMQMTVEFTRIYHPESIRRLGIANLLVDNEFGRYPLQAGRNYAAANNIFWYHEGLLNPVIDLRNIDYEVTRLKSAKPDWTIIQAEVPLAATAISAIRRVGVVGKFIGMPTAGGPDFLAAISSNAAENYYVGVTLPYPTDESNGMTVLKKWWREHQTNVSNSRLPEYTPSTQPDMRYIQGWATAMVLLEGTRRALVANPAKGQGINGDDIKAGLETLNNYDAEQLLPPLTFTAGNHKGSQMRFYKVEGGKWRVVERNISLAEMAKRGYAITPTPVPVTLTPRPR
ncbi:ABC transporter substrate-binding protein [Candidatus Chlorohelix sp.]|uniref:ABC transporter substrate-binding protein n=1 Tax=Candidatus Chlorohelix sp. TaxID=3139201 RepID=UPI0030306F34